jgi:phage FluMu protein Com
MAWQSWRKAPFGLRSYKILEGIVRVKFSFFSKLFGKAVANADGQVSTTEGRPSIDARTAECPYCKRKLAKIPGRKTKCPHCSEFMYVRTSPSDNARMVVTKEQADRIAEEWAIVDGTYDLLVAEKKQVEEERVRLRIKFGKEPSANDVEWGLLNKSLLEDARNGDWGLYRNDRFAMAEILRDELRLDQALKTCLEVCYLDLNGPTNTGGLTDPDLLREHPPFDPKKFGMLAPGIVDIVRRIVKKLAIDEAKVYSLFLEQNAPVFAALKLPLSPEQCWPAIRDELNRECLP